MEIMQEVEAFDKTNELVHKDLPELVLRSLKDRLIPAGGEVEEEAAWIKEQLPDTIKASKDNIRKYLETFRNEHLEAPYVYTYRTDLYDSEMIPKELTWEILRLDRNWAAFYQRRDAIINRITKAVKGIGGEYNYMREYVKNAKNIFEVEDSEEFMLFSEALISAANISQDDINMVIPGLTERQQEIAKLHALKFSELTSRFTLTPKEMHENLKKKEKNPPEVTVSLQTLAKNCLSPAAQISESYIHSQTITYLAAEIAATLPLLRKNLRSFMLGNALLSTLPTEKGQKELHSLHPYYRVKRILKRPLSTLKDDLWLTIQHSENEGLITSVIQLPEAPTEEFLKWAESLVKLDESQINEVTEEYNELRKTAIRKAIQEYLIPNVEKQIRQQLENCAAQFVIREIHNSFKAQLIVPPLHLPIKPVLGQTITKLVKIISIVVDDNKSAQVVVLNETGELLEEKLIDLVNTEIISDKEIQKKDLDLIKNLVNKHLPVFIIIGATCLPANNIFKQLSASSFIDECTSKPKVKLIKHPFVDTLELEASHEEFHKSTLRLAVSFGRYAQNPLAEVIYLFEKTLKYSREKLNSVMCLHSMQFMAGTKAVVLALKQAAIECVNRIGVNINLVSKHDHLKHLIKYISGLGKAKANHLLQTLRETGDLKKRIDLADRRIMKDFVFRNSAGFIIVAPENLDTYEILDSTRIHPDFYPKARQYAITALNEAKIEVPLTQNDNITILQAIKSNEGKSPLESYLSTANENKGNFEAMLLNELNEPFKFPEGNFHVVSEMELAYAICGYTIDSLFEGMITTVKVMGGEGKSVLCKLDDKLEGLLEFDNDASLNRSKFVRARVLRIVESDGSLIISFSARAKDLKEYERWAKIPHKDKAWFVLSPSDTEIKEDSKENPIEESKKPEAPEQSKYATRTIVHPRFRNVSISRAIEYLNGRDIGEYIFRPSSRGIDHLTLTLMFYKGIYVHIDIKEELKAPESSIGDRLVIGRDSFDNLEDIAEKYINPVIKRVKEVIDNRKFVNNRSLKFLTDYAKLKREENPDMIVYYLGIVPEYPQYVVLIICPREGDVLIEYVKVKPEGFYFHDKYFDTIEELIRYFKRHFTTVEYKLFLRKRNRPPVLQDQPSERVEEKMDDLNEYTKTEYLPNTEYQYMMNSIRIENLEQQTIYNEKGQFSVYNPDTKSRVNENELIGKRLYPESRREDLGFERPYAPGERGYSNARGRRGGRDYQFGSNNRQFNTIEESRGENSWGSERRPRYERRGSFSRGNMGEGRRFRRGGNGCHNCGEEGHFSRECPKPSRRGGRQSRGGRGCFNCNEEGHMSRDCPTRGRRGGLGGRGNCYNCGGSGHMSRECPEKRGERRGGRRGTGRGERGFGSSWETAQKEVSWDSPNKDDNKAEENKDTIREWGVEKQEVNDNTNKDPGKDDGGWDIEEDKKPEAVAQVEDSSKKDDWEMPDLTVNKPSEVPAQTNLGSPYNSNGASEWD